MLVPGGHYVFRFNETSATKVDKPITRIVNALGSQLEVIKSLRVISERIPFLKDEANFTAVVENIFSNIELYTLRNHYQATGQKTRRKNEKICAFFRDNFGDKAPYVEFLFYQLHETYPKLPKSFFFDADALKDLRRKVKEAQESGKNISWEN